MIDFRCDICGNTNPTHWQSCKHSNCYNRLVNGHQARGRPIDDGEFGCHYLTQKTNDSVEQRIIRVDMSLAKQLCCSNWPIGDARLAGSKPLATLRSRADHSLGANLYRNVQLGAPCMMVCSRERVTAPPPVATMSKSVSQISSAPSSGSPSARKNSANGHRVTSMFITSRLACGAVTATVKRRFDP